MRAASNPGLAHLTNRRLENLVSEYFRFGKLSSTLPDSEFGPACWGPISQRRPFRTLQKSNVKMFAGFETEGESESSHSI